MNPQTPDGTDAPSHGIDGTPVSELLGILAAYDKEITVLFGQVLTIYAGPDANNLDEKQKRENLRQNLEKSIPL